MEKLDNSGVGDAAQTPESQKETGSADKNTIAVELEIEGESTPRERQYHPSGNLLQEIRADFDIGAEVFLFERDADQPVSALARRRRAFRLFASRRKLVTVKVRYDADTEQRDFSPARTVLHVLRWAVSKKAHNLDPNQAAKANLILPGADEPLPKDSLIGAYVEHCENVLVVDLTLKDFTNGR